MSPERAGTPTHGTLDREKAREVLISVVATQVTSDAALDALEACVVPDPRISDVEPLPDAIVLAVRGGIPFTFEGIDFEPVHDVVPDPRIARIEAELDRHERETRLTERSELHLRRLRAILRGDQ